MTDTKNKVEHTPGPWASMGLSGHGLSEHFDIECRSETTTCHVATVEVMNQNWTARQRAEANARLIAAAPDMLMALKSIEAAYAIHVAFHGDNELTCDLNAAFRAVRRIINKAEVTPPRKFALRVIGSIPELRITDGDYLVLAPAPRFATADFETVGELRGVIRISDERAGGQWQLQ